jgi:IS1 family transposase
MTKKPRSCANSPGADVYTLPALGEPAEHTFASADSTSSPRQRGELAVRILPHEKKIACINGLCNGMSLRAVSRVFDVHRTTIMKLLVRVGDRCDEIMAEHMRDLDIKRLELDEIWTFCGKKQGRLRTLQERIDPEIGDQYLFFGIDHDTKLVPAWALGKRDQVTALELLYGLRRSLNGCRTQFSSDAWNGYEVPMGALFGDRVDWATLTKEYESVHPGPGRYAPPRVSSVTKRVQLGTPNEDEICTSIIERKNLTIRTMQRRFTRLTVAFSRKWDNLRAACALHFAYYNFCWQHRTLKGLTPALKAGVTPRLWTVADLVEGC